MKLRSGEYCAARVGVTLVLFYAKPMQELVDAVERLLDRYLAFIPQDAIQSTLSSSGVWRKFTKRSITADLRKFATKGVEYWSINLSSSESANVEDYGFHFFGSDLSHKDISPQETCVCFMEFPTNTLEEDRQQHFVEFAVAAAEIEEFEAGYGGYAFKHHSAPFHNDANRWIAQLAPRYIALDISYDRFKEVARRQLINVSWITLLGNALVQDLHGENSIRSQLSPRVSVKSLQNGLLLIAGESPPVGDVNRGAQDIEGLKEVAALTKPVRAKMEIGFGSDTFRHGWLDRFDKL